MNRDIISYTLLYYTHLGGHHVRVRDALGFNSFPLDAYVCITYQVRNA